MGKFKFIQTDIHDLMIIEPTKYEDDRGYFMEAYNKKDFNASGLSMTFLQDNEAYSQQKGVLRGLHYQVKHPQGKLVRVIDGAIFDVAVDIRENSITYGKWFGILLSSENKKQLYIPEGFAHGYLVLSESVRMIYKCTEFYHPEDETGIIWNDPNLGIAWPIDDEIPELIISDKDKNLPKFKVKSKFI